MTAPDDIIRIYNGVFEGGDTILQQIEELTVRMQKISKRSREASKRVQGVSESAQDIRQRAQKLGKDMLRMDEQDTQWGDEKLQDDEMEKINERLEQMNIPNKQISPVDFSPVTEKFSFVAPSLQQMSQLVVSGEKLNMHSRLRARSRSPRRNESHTSNQPRPRMESSYSKRKLLSRGFRRAPTPE